MNKIRYLKPNGSEITINDTEANREYAACSGWEEVKTKPKPKKKKKDSEPQLDKLI